MVDERAVLAEARMLPPPQDFRFAVFAVKAAYQCQSAVSKDCALLQKKAIIVRTQPLSCSLTFKNGLSAKVAIHPHYPEVPSGVRVESVDGCGWRLLELEAVKNASNCRCFSSLLDLHDYLHDQDHNALKIKTATAGPHGPTPTPIR